MRGNWRRCAVFALCFATCTASAAQAQVASSPFYKVVATGQRVKIASYASLDPTCRSLGSTNVSLVAGPQGGEVELLRGMDYPSYAATNVRFVCDKRRVSSSMVFYRAASTFKGNDSFEVEVVYPEGIARRFRYALQVR